MTKFLIGQVVLMTVLLAGYGLDYLTGNTFDMGRVYGEGVYMPTYWGAACLATSVYVVYGLLRRCPKALINASLVAFAINTMFAVQIADSRMLPVPWPPEDFRLLFGHVVHAGIWASIALALWWREGVTRRSDELLAEGEVA